jgi:hypothetical protein
MALNFQIFLGTVHQSAIERLFALLLHKLPLLHERSICCEAFDQDS